MLSLEQWIPWHEIKGFHETHKTIKWFWELLPSLFNNSSKCENVINNLVVPLKTYLALGLSLPLSKYFLIFLDINSLFVEERQSNKKWLIRFQPSLVPFIEFCLANFKVIFWTCEEWKVFFVEGIVESVFESEEWNEGIQLELVQDLRPYYLEIVLPQEASYPL